MFSKKNSKRALPRVFSLKKNKLLKSKETFGSINFDTKFALSKQFSNDNKNGRQP